MTRSEYYKSGYRDGMNRASKTWGGKNPAYEMGYADAVGDSDALTVCKHPNMQTNMTGSEYRCPDCGITSLNTP